MNRMKSVLPGLVIALVFAVGVSVLGAQELPGSGLATQNLRPYWHVFIAYAITIVFVLVWVISIGRRLRDVEERIGV
jgi:CcmD family protein